MCCPSRIGTECSLFFFFNDTATTEIYTLSLHDALPISAGSGHSGPAGQRVSLRTGPGATDWAATGLTRAEERSEEHTSELQSRQYLVCRLLLEKKKTNTSSSFFLIISF